MQADYSSGTPTAATNSSSGVTQGKSDYWGLEKLKRAYQDYLGNKREEIEEAKTARRYYHGAQWTEAQLKIMKKRKQPVTTINRIQRKLDGMSGIIERRRQDPKAFPRNPDDEAAADIATACIRYALDRTRWPAKSARSTATVIREGIGGLMMELVEDSRYPGDMLTDLEIVDPEDFFYDPRSFKEDFSDARYMGESKWLDLEQAQEMFPDKAEELEASIETGSDLTSNPDRENKWFDTTRKNIRLVDMWYKHKGRWCYALFTGSTVLAEGESPFLDENDEPLCKYLMFSAAVDHDGDRYSFVRNMKSLQDSINFKESKLNHILASRRLIITNGSVQDVEKARAEWARPDGVIVANPGGEVKADDQSFDFAGWDKLLTGSKTEIENYGPNPAVLGQGVEKQSGRAISLLQQAGIAEMGPFIITHADWKLRVYRAMWANARRYWSAERFVRVTDDEEAPKINELTIDPMTGAPTIQNRIAEIDVDIIIDEGPDSINIMSDTYDALLALAQSGAQVPPAVLIELSPGIDGRTKKKVLGMIEQASQPGPAQQIALQGEAAKVEETKSKTVLNLAKAGEAGQPEMAPPMQPQQYELPPELQNAKAIAEIDATYAKADQARASASKTQQEAMLAPMKMAQDARNAAEDRALTAQQFRQREKVS